MERKRGTKIIQKIFSIILLDLISILPLVYYYRKNGSLKKSFKKLGIKKIDKKELTKSSVSILIGLIAIMFLISFIASVINFNDLEKVDETVKKIAEESPFLMIYYLVFRVFTEELFFRGFLINFSENFLFRFFKIKNTGIFISSILFGLAHFAYGSLIEVFGAFIAGLFLAYSFKQRNNLVPVILGHMAFNAVGLILVL